MIEGIRFHPFDWDWVGSEDYVIITGTTEDEQIMNIYIDKNRMDAAMKVWLKVRGDKNDS